MSNYSISQIKSAYIQKKDWEKQFPVSRFLFRPLSFYLTYLVIHITESAPCVASFGFFIGFLGCFYFLFISQITIWIPIVLLILYALFDAVDGNIARVTNKVSYYGKYLDGVIGILIEASCWFWLGLGLYFNPGNYYIFNFFKSAEGRIFILFTATAMMAGMLYSRLIQGNYYSFLMQKQKDNSKQTPITQDIQSSVYRRHWWYLLIINLDQFNLQLVILALCVVFKILDLFLFFFSVYYMLRLLLTVSFYLFRGYKNLR